VDRQDFLKTLAEMGQKTGFKIHAYCLMSNHFHLVVKTPEANLVAGLRWLLNNENRQPTPDGKLEESEQQALSGAQDEGAVRQQ
jgi:REP element-mobilizing transposase RayT